MSKVIMCLVLLVIASASLISGLAAAAVPAQQAPGFVYAEGERLMLDGQLFIMKGFNYYPRDYGWTSMLDWDWQAVDREFALAEALHCNTIRTSINYQYSTNNVDARNGPLSSSQITPEYLTAIDRLLELADNHHLRVVFSLCDGLFSELWDPAQYDFVQQHLASLIPHYANDTRIAAWDLFTDLDGTMLLPAPTGAFGTLPVATKDNMIGLLRRMAQTVRALDSNHLLCVGFCWPSSALLVQDFTDFLFPQFLGADYPAITHTDAAGESEEYIDAWALLGDRQAALERIVAKIQSLQAQLKRPMPIVLSEYGTYTAPPNGSEAIQAAVYEAVCEAAFLRLHLAGALPWVLTDFNWPPKAFTYVLPDSPQWQPPEQTFGAFDLSYQPKPAAGVVARYHAERPLVTLTTVPDRIEFIFGRASVPAEQETASEDTRILAAAVDKITFWDGNGQALRILDIGTAEARPYLEAGFYADEGPWAGGAETFAWVGGRDRTGIVLLNLPEGTRAISIRAGNSIEGNTVVLRLGGETVGHKTLRVGWVTYRFELPGEDAEAGGNTQAVYGKLSLPFSEGLVTVQTSSDGNLWNDVAQVTPEAGRFVARIARSASGRTLVRAVFSGAGYYQGATSETLFLGAVAATPAPSVSPMETGRLPAVSIATPGAPATASALSDEVKKQAGRFSIWLLLLVGASILLLGVCAVRLRRRRGAPRG